MGWVIERGYTREEARHAVGAGWQKIVDRVFDYVEGHPTIKVEQVKEKFGGLRLYWYCWPQDDSDGVFDVMEALVREAERESFEVCEACGQPGVVRTGGWLKTLCDTHAKGRAHE